MAINNKLIFLSIITFCVKQYCSNLCIKTSISPSNLNVGILTPYVELIPDPTTPAGATCAGPTETEVGSDMIGVRTAADSVVIAADEVLLAMEDKATYDMDGTDDTSEVPESRE